MAKGEIEVFEFLRAKSSIKGIDINDLQELLTDAHKNKTHKNYAIKMLNANNILVHNTSNGANILLKCVKDFYNTNNTACIAIKSESDVADQLPKLIINQRYCTMPPNMAEINGRLFQELDEINELVNSLERKYKDPKLLETNEEYLTAKGKIMAYQTFLQELVDDPRLLSTSESNMAQLYTCNDISPKLDVLLELVDEITNAGSKVCIFTKFTRMQELLKQQLEEAFKFKCAIVNGSMSPEERYEQAYTLFGDNDEYKVLIGTDAMAEGISLSKCNYLIEYDLADSYAIQTQRHGRIKRANSIHKTGYVYQIICEESWDTIQEKIIAKKENYDNTLIQDLK